MDTLTLTPFAVSILIGTVLPILVGIVTKEVASGGLKSVLLLLFSAIQGLIVTATTVDGAAILSTEAIVVAGLGWVSAVASYYGFLKPTNVSGAVNTKTSDFGVGKSSN